MRSQIVAAVAPEPGIGERGVRKNGSSSRGYAALVYQLRVTVIRVLQLTDSAQYLIKKAGRKIFGALSVACSLQKFIGSTSLSAQRGELLTG